MSNHAQTARRFWECAEARDWDGFAEVLAPDVVYEAPQTRERVRGRDAYVRFNHDYPGDWHLTITRLVGDDAGAATEVAFTIGEEAMTGISFFSFDDDGRVLTVRDHWPEAYVPPPGREHLVERY